MNLKRLKKFISFFIVTVLLISFFVAYTSMFNSLAETAARVYSESGHIYGTDGTEETKPHGFKIEGVEYWDYNENYDKTRILIDEVDGEAEDESYYINEETSIVYSEEEHIYGTGGTEETKPHGFKIEGVEYWDNNENYDKSRIWIDIGEGREGETGGILGNSGIGLGDIGEVSSDNSTSSSSGSALADALRALKSEIEESRVESISKVLESAYNESFVRESISESESIDESIQKKLMQEQIKNKLSSKETKKKTFDALPDVKPTRTIQQITSIENSKGLEIIPEENEKNQDIVKNNGLIESIEKTANKIEFDENKKSVTENNEKEKNDINIKKVINYIKDTFISCIEGIISLINKIAMFFINKKG